MSLAFGRGDGEDPVRYERAALRWLQRFIDERLPSLAENRDYHRSRLLTTAPTRTVPPSTEWSQIVRAVEADDREAWPALIWPSPPVAGEQGVLAECEALVAAGLATWDDGPDLRRASIANGSGRE